MLIFPTLLFIVLKVFTCHSSAVKESELYFRLLQTGGQLTDTATIIFPPEGSGSRRLTPSDDLPIGDLIENRNEIYDPRPGDINVKRLRKQMGKNFDKEYMSINNPKNRMISIDESSLIPLIKGHPNGRRPRFLRLLRTARLQDGRKIKLNASKKERRKFQKYMWSLTFCPVRHSWKYLGIRFWPPWIKEGTCSSKRSCSIPEGMKCKPSASINKTFLRWHCKDFEGRKSCKWIPFLYPIISKCSCSC